MVSLIFSLSDFNLVEGSVVPSDFDVVTVSHSAVAAAAD
jgi:hypothetical protein